MTLYAQDARFTLLIDWLSKLGTELSIDPTSVVAASSDASFRRYFRVSATTRTLVVMDAPPPNEDCRPFIDVTQRLIDAGLNVPHVIRENLSLGFLLLTDLGPTTYYDRIENGIDDPSLQNMYRQAVSALVQVQQARKDGLAVYDAPRLKAELSLFNDWYLSVHYKMTLDGTRAQAIDQVFDLLVQHNSAQPSVFVHRDFHSPNLMYCAEAQYGPNPGILDYQDAVSGPITYDLASLVMDARTTWEEPQQLDWAIRYWEQARKAGLPVPTDFADFHRDYEWMGLQRNLRILGVFARLNYRDHKAHYLAHLPRVNQYVRQVAGRYLAFRPLIKLLDQLDNIQPSVGYTF